MIQLEQKIKTKLKERNLTIEKLAVYSGITKQTVHNIFKKNDVKLSQLKRISEVLNVGLDYFLLEGTDHKNKAIELKADKIWSEVNQLKRENDLLREMVEIIKHKEAV